jgi:hypothetical protein
MAGRGRGRWLGDGRKTDPPVTKSAGGATGYFELHPDTLGYVLGLGENLRRYYYYYYYALSLSLPSPSPSLSICLLL